MAPRKKAPKVSKPADEVDAEFVETAPSVQARSPKPSQAAKPSVEAEIVGEDTAEGGEPDEIEPLAEDLEEVTVAPDVPIKPARRVAGLARHDPLSAYMAEVTKHPLLSREEETALARRYRETGDVAAAYKLVASNLRLVVKLAHEYHRNPLALLDLVQEGNIGLMQAVKKFDPDRGVKMSSYAAWWIRAYILRYIMDNWKMVKLGTTEAQRKLFFKLRQEQERLLRQGVEATPKLLAERLNVTERDVVEMDQRLGNDEVSLDAPLGSDEEHTRTRGDRLLPTQSVSADDALGNRQLRELFRTKLLKFSEGLTEKERFIFEKRLVADEPMTLQDIGGQYGVSRERARQLEAALIDRMRQYMREEIPDFDLVAEAERD